MKKEIKKMLLAILTTAAIAAFKEGVEQLSKIDFSPKVVEAAVDVAKEV